MNLHNQLYTQYESKRIGDADILRAYDKGYITTESANAIMAIEPKYTLEEAIKFKKEQLSYLCSKAIGEGMDVVLSDGNTHHFSLTKEDQINLTAMSMNILSGATEFDYHADGEPCKSYSVEDMSVICATAQAKVSSETTYYNCLVNWARNCKTVDDVKKINYGNNIPEEYWTQSWRKIISTITDVSDENQVAEEKPKNILSKIVQLITAKK